jgi:predicted esterase/transglutaminase-like putative cysteine protease
VTPRSARYLVVLLLVSMPVIPASAAPPREEETGGSPEVARALARAGTNRAELVKALRTVPADRRQGLVFLIANMPDRDLRSLSAAFLLENVALAYQARAQLPWGRQIPEAIFLNDVLPYANVDEARDPWRKQLGELCLPLVKDCKSASEAACVLNAAVFRKLKVRYSTGRKQPHQSPKETIAQGLATCTGLSILLSDACRSVCVPARLAGTPLWANGRGNHTWVEVWDGAWHFTGAAEQDPKGLDRAWFTGDAAQAKADSRLNAIYAASFHRTSLNFPLVWAPDSREVFAENVTARYARPTKAAPRLTPDQRKQIEKAAADFFAAPQDQQADWKFDAGLDRLLTAHEKEMRRLAWDADRVAPSHDAMKKDFASHQVRYRQYVSPYAVRAVGRRPAAGWPLFIAMHGGGGAPKAVNDSQWQVMQHYYRDQKTVPGYLYLALRAPNDTWNGFYDTYVPPLVANLIRQFVLLGDVDSNKVFLMGYSHGGYGAFYIGPKMPDRFAAIHASAAAPTDGAISARTLRNTRFTCMVGELDNAYGRRQRCEKFAAEIQRLRQDNPGDYPVMVQLVKGFGHGGLPDRDKIRDMYSFQRNPVPRHLSWLLTDGVLTDFFWLRVPHPAGGQEIDAIIQDNTVRLTTSKVGAFDVNLDSRLVAFERPLRVEINGKEQEITARPRFLVLCQSLLERGDPELAFTCRLRLQGREQKQAP